MISSLTSPQVKVSYCVGMVGQKILLFLKKTTGNCLHLSLNIFSQDSRKQVFWQTVKTQFNAADCRNLLFLSVLFSYMYGGTS